MQKGYCYELSEPVGRNFDPEFKPELTPQQMLALGVFSGKYMTDCNKECPASWFKKAKLSPKGRDCSLNYFGGAVGRNALCLLRPTCCVRASLSVPGPAFPGGVANATFSSMAIAVPSTRW
jgi:hypothetical protein